ncbi:DUF1569 domain-containing protein [Crocinitomicaceae bacterium]|nr:DUF1569 domain-containing protein [Crocinitomicaceae bacterium]MDB3906427.1 DUF1569 domain-containing protein [Crocinitomicaceae bacterium]
MNYLEPNLANALAHFNKLTTETKPLWGTMSPIGMIEHITDSLHLAQGKFEGVRLGIPEDKVERALKFLHSEHPMPKNFKAPFGAADEDNRNKTLDEAIQEFEAHWPDFENHFKDNPGIRHIHPSFGNLNYEEWLRVHSKHLTHHFQQFGLIPS